MEIVPFNELPYRVVVQIEETFLDEERIDKALREKGFKGALYYKPIVLSESSEETDWVSARIYALGDPAQFEVFKEAMMTVKGVVGVKKHHSWS